MSLFSKYLWKVFGRKVPVEGTVKKPLFLKALSRTKIAFLFSK